MQANCCFNGKKTALPSSVISKNQNKMETAVGVTTEVSSPRTASKPKLVLKLKEKKSPTIRWSDDTVDNEHLGRKSSKRCCIFHKNKVFGESDSDESDSDTEVAKRAPQAGRPKNYQRHHA